MPRHLPIKDWALEDRPREKLVKQGQKSLTDAELLAILLGSGTKNETAVMLAKHILAHFDHQLDRLSQCSVAQMCGFIGVGLAKATRLVAAFELGRRQKQTARIQMTIRSSLAIFELLQPQLGNLQHEEFWVVYLNQANRLLAFEQLSRGGISQTSVDIRLACKRALELGAVALILAHNHPSGQIQPSASDHALTKKFVLAAKSIDINVLDHLIITENTYFSFADEEHL